MARCSILNGVRVANSEKNPAVHSKLPGKDTWKRSRFRRHLTCQRDLRQSKNGTMDGNFLSGSPAGDIGEHCGDCRSETDGARKGTALAVAPFHLCGLGH